MHTTPCAIKEPNNIGGTMNIISIIYGPWTIWWVSHTWSRGGGILNNAYGTLKKSRVDKTMNIFVAESFTFGGWTFKKVNGSMNIVGVIMSIISWTMNSSYGTMGTIGGTMSTVGGTKSKVYRTMIFVYGRMIIAGGNMSIDGGTMSLLMEPRALIVEP